MELTISQTARICLDILDAGLVIDDYVRTHGDLALLRVRPFPQVVMWI